MTLTHVLGSAIPHHNLTVLNFFNDVMQAELPPEQPRHFMVVTQQPEAFAALHHLHIETFSSKRSLAKALAARARDRRQRFFFHGQYNAWIWLALLTGAVRRHQVLWHIWGADLYEASSRLKFRLFYLLRRRAQGSVGQVFATQGDLTYYQQRYPQVPATRLYFPTRLAAAPPELTPDSGFTVLLGNSGDASNRHIAGLKAIRAAFGERIRVLLPMGYPASNEAYIQQVAAAAAELFPGGQVTVLRDQLGFEAYRALIARVQLGYFMFERQQGIGTLSLFIQASVPFVLNRQNPFWHDIREQGLPLLFSDEVITEDEVAHARQQLMNCDKQAIAFFAPGYVVGWRDVLRQCEKESR